MYITRQMLGKAGMHYRQRVAFRNEWPNGVEVTQDSLTRATGLGTDVHWFAFGLFLSHQLPYEAWQTYNQAEDIAQEAFAQEIVGIARPYYPYADRTAAWQIYHQTTITALLTAPDVIYN